MISVAREGMRSFEVTGSCLQRRWSIKAKVMVVLPKPMLSARIPPRIPSEASSLDIIQPKLRS